jgi:TorA maturation chaperone TorD
MDDMTTHSEQFRHRCEVQYVAQHPKEWIKRYLEGVKKQRGEAGWFKLRQDVIKAWKGRNKRG